MLKNLIYNNINIYLFIRHKDRQTEQQNETKRAKHTSNQN